jgi:hypothetical protein
MLRICEVRPVFESMLPRDWVGDCESCFPTQSACCPLDRRLLHASQQSCDEFLGIRLLPPVDLILITWFTDGVRDSIPVVALFCDRPAEHFPLHAPDQSRKTPSREDAWRSMDSRTPRSGSVLPIRVSFPWSTRSPRMVSTSTWAPLLRSRYIDDVSGEPCVASATVCC